MMKLIASVYFLVLTSCAGAASLQAQQLPPAVPTTTTAAPPIAEPPTVQSQLNVKYASGQLSITATNASLKQILSEVAKAAGIKITGEVSDDQVFGQYGPAAPQAVLAELLDGTGINILMVGRELTLTARHGGPTPPSPDSSHPEQPEKEDRAMVVPPVPAPHVDPPAPAPTTTTTPFTNGNNNSPFSGFKDALKEMVSPF
jgi:hypothetical protein